MFLTACTGHILQDAIGARDKTKFQLDPKYYSNKYNQTLIAFTFIRGTVKSLQIRYKKKLTTPLKFSELKTWLVNQV